MSTFNQKNSSGQSKSEAQKRTEESDAQALQQHQDAERRTQEEAQKAGETLSSDEKPANEQKPANVQQEELGRDLNNKENTADTENTSAGDLAAAEGNDFILDSSTGATAEASSAASRTQTGPSQEEYFDQQDKKTADTTEGPVKIQVTEGQEVGVVQERIDAELGDLAAAPMEEGKMVTGDGVVAIDKPGTLNAAFNGVQQDASGHFESVAHTRSSQSGTRV